MTANPYVVMVKPVGSLCNMRCAFCYYLEKNAEREDGEIKLPGRMSFETLEKLCRQYIESSPGPVVSFTWHGGEPTLAGLDFYKEAVEFQKKYLPEGWSAWNNLQTNGLLLNDEWSEFLAGEKFQVGLSIDGVELIHDKYRLDNSGSGTYKKAAAAIALLQSHGIQPDLLCTVTSDTAKRPLDVYRALRNFKTGWIQFIPIVKDEPGSMVSVGGKAYGDFLCSVFDEWLLNDLGKLDVQLFAETMQIRRGGNAGLCIMAPACGRALIVEQDGSVYSCDHFVEADYRIGDIHTADLGELADSPFQQKFGNDKKDLLPEQCLSCAYLKYCRGGCPKDRLVLSGGETSGEGHSEKKLNILCEGYKRFFSYTEPALNLVDALARQGQGADAIMAELRQRLAQLWKGVRRNDPCPCKSGLKAKHCCWERRQV